MICPFRQQQLVLKDFSKQYDRKLAGLNGYFAAEITGPLVFTKPFCFYKAAILFFKSLSAIDLPYNNVKRGSSLNPCSSEKTLSQSNFV